MTHITEILPEPLDVPGFEAEINLKKVVLSLNERKGGGNVSKKGRCDCSNLFGHELLKLIHNLAKTEPLQAGQAVQEPTAHLHQQQVHLHLPLHTWVDHLEHTSDYLNIRIWLMNEALTTVFLHSP